MTSQTACAQSDRTHRLPSTIIVEDHCMEASNKLKFITV